MDRVDGASAVLGAQAGTDPVAETAARVDHRSLQAIMDDLVQYEPYPTLARKVFESPQFRDYATEMLAAGSGWAGMDALMLQRTTEIAQHLFKSLARTDANFKGKKFEMGKWAQMLLDSDLKWNWQEVARAVITPGGAQTTQAHAAATVRRVRQPRAGVDLGSSAGDLALPRSGTATSGGFGVATPADQRQSPALTKLRVLLELSDSGGGDDATALTEWYFDVFDNVRSKKDVLRDAANSEKTEQDVMTAALAWAETIHGNLWFQNVRNVEEKARAIPKAFDADTWNIVTKGFEWKSLAGQPQSSGGLHRSASADALVRWGTDTSFTGGLERQESEGYDKDALPAAHEEPAAPPPSGPDDAADIAPPASGAEPASTDGAQSQFRLKVIAGVALAGLAFMWVPPLRNLALKARQIVVRR